MTRCCRSCGTDISDRPPKHFLCLKCYGTAARELRTGKETLGLTCSAIGMTPERCEQLIRLTSNDNSAEAAAVTEWLTNALRVLKEGRG